MIKKILIILLFPSLLFSYSINDFKINSEGAKFTFTIKLHNKVTVSKNFYDYGVNLTLNNFNFNKIFIKKLDKYIIKIIPLEKDKTLIKIQSLDKFNKDLFNINLSEKDLKIVYGNNINIGNAENKQKSVEPKKKISNNEEDKIIEDITKSVFDKSNITTPLGTKKVVNKPANKNNNMRFTVQKSDFISRIIKTYSLLALMCVILICIAFIFKKIKNKSLIKVNNEFFKIIYRQPIAPKKEIGIIKLYDEYLVIGITDYNINLIAKIESDHIKREIKLIEGEKEKKKFIKYINEENKKIESKEKEIDRDYLISSIEKKIKKYKDLIN